LVQTTELSLALRFHAESFVERALMVASNEAANAPAEAGTPAPTAPFSAATSKTPRNKAAANAPVAPAPAPTTPLKETAALSNATGGLAIALAPGQCQRGSETFNSVALSGFSQKSVVREFNTCYIYSELDSDKLPVFVAANGAKVYHSTEAGPHWGVISADASKVCVVRIYLLIVSAVLP
jgi:hypothetical protein